MPFSKYDQEWLVPFWRSYITPALGKKAANQFIRATLNPSNWLADTIIKPRLFQPDAFGGVYYPVDIMKFSTGRNHYLAEIIATNPDPVQTFGGDPWVGLMLFANPLRLWTPYAVGEDEQDNAAVVPDAPKDRVALGEHHIFTYEFDVADPAFLEVQLSWLRQSKKGCPIENLFRHCSGFADFCGLTVNWSGNKSLHIHVVFTTSLARARLGLGGCSSADLRCGFAFHWERLHEDLLSILDPGGYRADAQLRFAESFRRIPNGSRKIEKGHLLGFPEGKVVPQVTLWERSRMRASGDKLPLFFQPEPFQADVRPVRTKAIYSARKKIGPNLTPVEVDYCEARLREWYPGWPRFDHLTYEGDRWVAKFKNSETDNNPSSIMREDYSSIHLAGRDAAGLSARSLPFPLGVMLLMWRGWFASEEGRKDEAVNLDDITSVPSPTRIRHPYEAQFRANVIDRATALSEMEVFFRTTVPTTPLLLVVGPEGVGKTSVLMSLHHELVADLERRGESPLSMYAFADYEAVAKKCAAFNAVQGANGFIGVVIPSFSRVYAEECERLGIKMISTEEAARRNCSSRWAAIEKYQPGVLARFRERHNALWADIGQKKPVFFTVHQVAHAWKKSSPSRLMWAPSFWNSAGVEGAEHLKMLRQETTLGLLVHDEIKDSNLVHAYRDGVVRWAESLVDSDTYLWCAENPSLPKLLKSFEDFAAENAPPMTGGCSMTFEQARAIVEIGFSRFDHVLTADTGEYGCHSIVANTNGLGDDEAKAHHDIYAERHGRDWQIASQDWWHGVADRVILLTTEAVPTAVARTADSDFAVFELETPRAPRDIVDVHPSRFVRGDNLATECQKFRDEHSDEEWSIISNKVAMLEGTMTHARAKGSNDLIGKNVVQTITWMTPDEYERLQALNAWTGRSDLVGLRYVDEFNQSAGRNLGFRRQGAVKHHLLINLRLFEVLLDHKAGVLGRARYGLRLLLDRHQRYEATGRRKEEPKAA